MRKNSSFFVFCIFFIFAACAFVYAEEEGAVNQFAGSFKGRTLALDINVRVLEKAQVVVWDKSQQKETISGSPVGLKLVGSNVVVAVQFTPFIRRGGNVLAVQGQIWVNDPQKGMCYYTSIQTIPMEFGEPVYFFPLGSAEQANESNASVEIIITVNPEAADPNVRVDSAPADFSVEPAANPKND